MSFGYIKKIKLMILKIKMIILINRILWYYIHKILSKLKDSIFLYTYCNLKMLDDNRLIVDLNIETEKSRSK